MAPSARSLLDTRLAQEVAFWHGSAPCQSLMWCRVPLEASWSRDAHTSSFKLCLLFGVVARRVVGGVRGCAPFFEAGYFALGWDLASIQPNACKTTSTPVALLVPSQRYAQLFVPSVVAAGVSGKHPEITVQAETMPFIYSLSTRQWHRGEGRCRTELSLTFLKIILDVCPPWQEWRYCCCGGLENWQE